ncbi:MAG: methyltransferase domain-containing protein [Proteobacteria bacterium]|nr:methyltransferase domain-containing protein [Pseudomonadota bacterium]
MLFFKRIGLIKLAWSVRRLHCPVDKKSLVLEVGSGGNPYFRSNVLIDAYSVTRERHWQPLIADRPTVLGFVENLPFKSKSFDFVVASHVFEHTPFPEKFLSELQRVAKAGYIEVPDAFMERINPYLDHRLEITVRNNELIVRKKHSSEIDSQLVELYRHKASSVITNDTMRRFPFNFHVRYYWNEKIKYTVLNPEVDAAWPAPEQKIATPKDSTRAKVNIFILSIIRRIFSQNQRNKKIDLYSLLQCPSCGYEQLSLNTNTITCTSCKKEFPIINGIPDMTVKK